MAVVWKEESLKALHDKQKNDKTKTDEISELQDAIIELAEIVASMTAKEDNNG